MKDTDLMPFGPHKGKRLIDVPGGYLLFLYYEARQKLNEGWPNLLIYIEENLDVLKSEK